MLLKHKAGNVYDLKVSFTGCLLSVPQLPVVRMLFAA